VERVADLDMEAEAAVLARLNERGQSQAGIGTPKAAPAAQHEVHAPTVAEGDRESQRTEPLAQEDGPSDRCP